MTIALAGFFVGSSLLLVVVAASIALLLERRRRDAPVDSTTRAGSPDEPDSQAAALRAGGRTAWTRLGGGGF